MEEVNEKAKELEKMERNFELLEQELKDHIWFLKMLERMLEREGGVIGR
jgi:NTP pyrophosphatase (non-canonical NTP hydrolase)